jgi:hypothetical protein
MLKRLLTVICAMALSGVALGAQEAKPAPKSAEKPADKAPAKAEGQAKPIEPPALPINIKIEVSISDQTGNNAPARKVVSMIASDRQPTNIRSNASVPVKMAGSQSFQYRTVTINVDARPAIVQKEPNKISLNFGLEYFPKSATAAQEEIEPGMASWSERLSLILESGKPMIVSQAADPTSDRKITVEVTATILK